MKELLHPEEIITSFLLIRHGHTKPLEDGKFYSDPNVPLTETGINQAKQVAVWMQSQNTDELLTSPAVRARQTAETIAETIKLPPKLVEGLDEWEIGEWKGKDYFEIRRTHPDVYHKWSADPIHNVPPGGESIEQLCARVNESLRHLIEKHQGKSITLVTHAGVIRAILLQALEIPLQNFWRINVPTCSVAKIGFSKNFASVHYVSFQPNI